MSLQGLGQPEHGRRRTCHEQDGNEEERREEEHQGEGATAKPAAATPTPETVGQRAEKLATKAKGTKAKPNDKPKAMSCLDAAAHVLKAKGEAMNCKGMIDAMFAGKLWHSDAPTPAATLSSAILREVTTKGDAARFKKVDRGQFAFNG